MITKGVYEMSFIFDLAVFAVIFIIFIYLSVHELLCVYRNPFPLFHNGDKRFGEVLADKTKNIKTRSILKDIET